ncbi:MAG: large-conductance mechanosensitive channel protein MscL [Erysipelotrichaceae bacterium]|nr:large-conductance mechanosensitive channel protein MscL [Erysipelotrichaceae bacterium]MDY5251829.1 large-conductance mechanosensitive channel protein MscL [Erysipelotrichaceae bacterium]
MNKTKSFINEFKQFISKGSVVDLAVGVIIGSSFTTIVNSLVNDIIMPLTGWLFGGIDFTSLRYIVKPAAPNMAEAAINYGNFIQNVVNFLLVSFVVFCMVKAINRFRRKEDKAKAPAKPSAEVELLTEIRDLLKKTS